MDELLTNSPKVKILLSKVLLTKYREKSKNTILLDMLSNIMDTLKAFDDFENKQQKYMK